MFDMIADQRIASCPPRGRESLGGQLTVYFLFEYGEATFVAIELVCEAKSGTLYWGCPQLECGRLPGPFNMVIDGDFSLTKNDTAGSTPRLFSKGARRVYERFVRILMLESGLADGHGAQGGQGFVPGGNLGRGWWSDVIRRFAELGALAVAEGVVRQQVYLLYSG